MTPPAMYHDAAAPITLGAKTPTPMPGAVPLRPVPPAEARSIGSIIQDAHKLSAEQVEQVLAHQRQHGTMFGEAAVALGLIRHDDVLSALSQQFQYPTGLTRELDRDLVTAVKPFSPQAEVFRSLRSQVVMRLAADGQPQPAIAVVSPESGDGKTFLAANLAIAFSQLGGRTLLLDADMRNPRQHKLFGVDNASGLSHILSGRDTTRVVHPVAELPSLYVLPVGTLAPNPLELVSRPAFGLLLHDLQAKFDHIVVDTPAASGGSDGAVIAARCGAALVVARAGRSHLRGLEQLVSLLRAGPAQIVGAVLNQH